MESETQTQTGYSICTYRVRLYDRHLKWIIETRDLYEKVIIHFLTVLEQEPELLEQSDFNLLRSLEIKCIGTKEMKAQGMQPEFPITDLPKIPLYFRRSAINVAIACFRNAKLPAGTSLDQYAKNCPMILYKGMYREFQDASIELKLFNGEKWVWVTYPFVGRSFPKDAEKLSPALVIEKKTAYLNVPVEVQVKDVRTVKERMQQEEQICAIAFPDHDVLAVAVILSKSGEEQECRFFRGGKQKEYQKKRILKQIQTSIKSRGLHPEKGENATLYSRLRKINRYYAHCISKHIVEYCFEKKIKIIVVPNYETSIDFKDKQYLKTDNFRWIGRAIIKNLKYKAFQNGMIVTSVRPYHISDTCSECGTVIAKYNEGHTAGTHYYGGKLYICPNGHKGNSAENAAKNIGRNFLNYYKTDS